MAINMKKINKNKDVIFGFVYGLIYSFCLVVATGALILYTLNTSTIEVESANTCGCEKDNGRVSKREPVDQKKERGVSSGGDQLCGPVGAFGTF